MKNKEEKEEKDDRVIVNNNLDNGLKCARCSKSSLVSTKLPNQLIPEFTVKCHLRSVTKEIDEMRDDIYKIFPIKQPPTLTKQMYSRCVLKGSWKAVVASKFQ